MKFQKILSLGIGICIFLALSIGFGFSELKTDDYDKPTCSSYGAIFLKESEESLMGEMADVSGISSVPSKNQIIAKTDVMKCDSFNYENYIKFNDDKNLQKKLNQYLKGGDYKIN